VTDQAGFLSAPVVAELEQRLAAYELASGHQVLLWIGHTTGGEPLETWAVRTFAAWHVGRKGLDDGVVLFVLADDRKLRIEVGYGLEARLPDVRAARIIREQIAPRLQAGDRDGAARAGITAIVDVLGGGPNPTADIPERGRPSLGLGQLILLGIVGLLLVGFVATHPGLALLMLTNIGGSGGRRSGSRDGWGGGGFGGGGGFSGGGGRSGGGGASGSW
jgi:uncharacterized protein